MQNNEPKVKSKFVRMQGKSCRCEKMTDVAEKENSKRNKKGQREKGSK